MLAKYEFRRHHENTRVWFGRYLSPLNLPHWHFDAEILYCRQGSAMVSIDGNEIKLGEGESAYVASTQIHWVNSSKGSIIDFVIFDSSLLGRLHTGTCLVQPFLGSDPSIPHLIDQIIEEKKNKGPLYKEVCDAKVVECVALLLRSRPTYPRKEEDNRGRRYLELLEKIDDEFEAISFEDAADFMGFTPTYFSSYFKKMTGTTFSSYLNALRVEKAIPLIQKGELRMSEVAFATGFGTIRNFNRVFFEITGYAPSDLPEDYSLSSWQSGGEFIGFDPTDKGSTLIPSES